jgi:6-phosphogluconolactonase (cycloisomerase 2 family)
MGRLTARLMSEGVLRGVSRVALFTVALSALAACDGGSGETTGSSTSGAAGSVAGSSASTGTNGGTPSSSTSAASSTSAGSSTGAGAGPTGTTGGAASSGSTSGGTTGVAGPTTYVYVESNDPSTENKNAILAYRRVGNTLVPLSGVSSFALGGAGVGDMNFDLGPEDIDQPIVIDKENERLYAVNQATQTVGGFDINSDGSLTALQGSPYFTGDGPVSLSIAGNLLYVANQASDKLEAPNYVALTINSDGSLSSIPWFKPFTTAVGASPSQVLISPDQKHIFGADFLGPMASPPINPIRSLQLTSDGGIVRAPGDPYAVPASAAPGNPVGNSLALGLAVHPTENILYVGFVIFDDVGVFTYDSSGALTYITAAPMMGSLVCWLRVNSAGTRMYASNTGDASVSELDLTFPKNPVENQHFLLKDSHGTPFTGLGQPQVVTSAPYQLALSPDEKFLFVVSQRVTVNPNDTTSPGNILHTLVIADDGTLSEPGADVPIATPITARAQGVATIALP